MPYIDILANSHEAYERTFYCASKLHEAMQEYGIASRLIIMHPNSFCNYIDQVIKTPPQLSISFCDLSLNNGSKLLCDQLCIPHLFWTQSDPYLFMNYLDSPYGYLGCTDRLPTQLLQQAGKHNIAFLPDAVDAKIFINEENQRPYQVVLFENLADSSAFIDHWKNTLDPKLFSVVEKTIEDVRHHSQLPFEALFAHVTSDLPDENYNFGWLLYELTLFFKAERILQIIQSLKNVRVDVFGNHTGQDWLLRLKNAQNVHLHADVAYTEKFSILKQTQIVIRDQHHRKAASDDIVLNSIAMGALVLTTETDYLTEHFSDQELVYYNLNDQSMINELVQDYLHNHELRKNVVMAGQLKAANHSWHKRVLDINNFIHI